MDGLKRLNLWNELWFTQDSSGIRDSPRLCLSLEVGRATPLFPSCIYLLHTATCGYEELHLASLEHLPSEDLKELHEAPFPFPPAQREMEEQKGQHLPEGAETVSSRPWNRRIQLSQLSVPSPFHRISAGQFYVAKGQTQSLSAPRSKGSQ